jgi:hypothetical protein
MRSALTTADRRQVRQRIPQGTDNITEGAGKTLMVINI